MRVESLTSYPVGGLLVAVLLSCTSSAADIPSCEPVTDCAFRMAREMTLKNATRAQDGDSLRHWLRVTEWLEGADPQPEAAAARVRFAVLQKQVGRVKDPKERPISEQWLASAMIEAGLLVEAEKIAKSLPAKNRDVVYRNLSRRLAKQGNWREAVRILELLSDAERDSPFAYQEVMSFIAAAGDPEIIRQSATLMKAPPEFWLPVGLAIADLAAGKEDAAIQRAMSHKEIGWQVGILGALSDHYRDQKREIDSLRLKGRQLELARADASGQWLEEEYKWYFRRLVHAREFHAALEAWPHLPADDRNPWGELSLMLLALRKPEDIAAATKLLPQLSGRNLETAERALIWARALSGLAEPGAALKRVATPDAAGRHIIEWLGGDYSTDEDRTRARALLAAAQAVVVVNPNPDAFDEMFRPVALVKAQIRLGLLEDARASIGAVRDARWKAEFLLKVSFAHSRLGQADLARTARVEGMGLLAQLDTSQNPDLRAEVLVDAGLLDDAEAELRQLMTQGASSSASRNVVKSLLQERLERGETQKAFQFAADWSKAHDDPAAIGTFYGLLTKKGEPPPDLGRFLRRMQSGGSS